MKRKLKALLDLGRVANWPTVWSNCLAAWILAGAGFSAEETMGLYELSGIFSVHVQRLWIPLLLIPVAAATLLYIGGVALNDAFDANYDKEHRSERPVPSGALPLKHVWIIGVVCLLVGTGIFLNIGLGAGDLTLAGLAILLTGLIVVYDWMHKKSPWAVLPMGGCRFVLYALVAVSAIHVTHIHRLSEKQSFEEMAKTGLQEAGFTSTQLGSVLAIAGAMFVYIVVLTLSARAESGTESLKVSRKLSLLLYLPLLVAIGVFFLNEPEGTRFPALLGAGTVFVVWVMSAVRVLYDENRDRSRIGIAVGRLLAGICLVDAMAIAAVSPGLMPVVACGGLFVFAILLQRLAPAT